MFGVISAAQTGFCGESAKVDADSISEDRVSGICDKLVSVDFVSSPGKVNKIQEECRQVLQQRYVRVC